MAPGRRRHARCGDGGGAHSQQLVVGRPGAARRLGCAVHGCLLPAMRARGCLDHRRGLLGAQPHPPPALAAAAARAGWQWAVEKGRSGLSDSDAAASQRHLSGARSGADTPLPLRGCPLRSAVVCLGTSKVPGTELGLPVGGWVRRRAATHGSRGESRNAWAEMNAVPW